MGTTDSWVRNRSKSCKNCCKMLHVRFSPLLGGGLEPLFRVLFSAIFHGVSPGISIRVENYGIERKENCSQSVVILRTELICVGAILCLFTGMWRIPAHAAFRSSYLRRHPLSQGTYLGLHMSKNWGGHLQRKPLFGNLLHWPAPTSPKFSSPTEMPHDLSSISEFRFNAKEH